MEELQTQKINMQKHDIAMKNYEICMKELLGWQRIELNLYFKFCESIKKRYGL